MLANDRPKVAAYIRYSTADQAKGWTEEYQMEICEGILTRKDWSIDPDMVFVDRGISGYTIEKRPAFRRMLGLIQEGKINKVVSWKLDRVSRNTAQCISTIKDDWHGKCHLVTSDIEYEPNTQMGLLLLSLGATFADVERMTIRDRTMEGRIKNAQHGLYTGNGIPFGYSVENKQYVQNDDAATVLDMFERARTQGIQTIAKSYNAEGITSPRCKGWSPQSVRHILTNQFYAGVAHFGKVVQACDNIPPIVTKELYDEVQEAIDRRNTNRTRYEHKAVTNNALLSGIIKCDCGATMKTHKAYTTLASGERVTYHYYRCRAAMDKGMSVCRTGLVPQDKADQAVLEKLDRILHRDGLTKVYNDLKAADVARLTQAEAAVASLARQIDDIEGRLTTARKKNFMGELPDDEYRAQVAIAKDMQADARDRLRLVTAEYDQLKGKTGQADAMQRHIAMYAEYANLDRTRQKALIRNLVRQVTVKADNVGRGKKPVFTIDVTTNFPV